jgi:DNA-binding transcriptional LysR family regulator
VELRHLRYVIAVAEELHFGRAAQRLKMSQPPLSQQIRQIEDQLGIRFFQRTKRNVELTVAGRAFVDEARLILEHVDRAMKVAVRAHRGEIGHLTIGTVTSTDSGFYRVLVDILQRFAGRYPEVHLTLRTLSVAQQMQDMHDGRLDVGFVTLPIHDPLLTVRKVRGEPLVAALPENHALCRQSFLSAKDMAREPHILCPRNVSPGYFDLIIGYFQRTHCSPNIVHEGDNIYTSLALVAAGLGIGLFPASLLDVKRKGIVVRQLRPPVPHIEMGAAYRRDRQSAALKLFLDLVKQVRS